ncbi:MAG TPA: MFS transporter [Burkholderiales bacterium]|nr:MFS transporter [Burkholderiales bacterium]
MRQNSRTLSRPTSQVLALGTTQTIAWASSTYLPAILATPIAAELGISRATVFGAFSVSLIVMAIGGPAFGRIVDAGKGRGLLMASNAVLAAGLVFLGLATGPIALFAAWCVIGVGMAMGLYDSAFAVLVRLHGHEARGAITGITLIAGFASTVGWPLTAWLSADFGWRAACFAWAAIHIVIALPLNRFFLPLPERLPEKKPMASEEEAKPAGRAFTLVAVFFALTAFVTSAMAAHLPNLLLATGVSTAAALTASALLGPAQVVARLAEFFGARHFRLHPLFTARLATATHPVAAIAFGALGATPLGAAAFAVVHGTGNGLITIARGTVPLAIFGAAGYGARQGWLSALGRVMQALAPYVFGVVLDGYGVAAALLLSGSLSLAALGALLCLRR